MKKVIFLVTAIALNSCNQGKPLEPFSLVVYDYDYAMAFSKKYVLTESDLSIVFRGELEGEKDSTIFSFKLEPSKELREISSINFLNLNEEYKNNCIDDGSQISFQYSKNSSIKNIHLSNYYQNDIGQTIEFINNNVPKKLKIYYNKKELLQEMKECNE